MTIEDAEIIFVTCMGLPIIAYMVGLGMGYIIKIIRNGL